MAPTCCALICVWSHTERASVITPITRERVEEIHAQVTGAVFLLHIKGLDEGLCTGEAAELVVSVASSTVRGTGFAHFRDCVKVRAIETGTFFGPDPAVVQTGLKTQLLQISERACTRQVG